MLYEQAVRDKVAELMNEGTTAVGSRYDIAAALKAARECSEARTWKIIEKTSSNPRAPPKSVKHLARRRPLAGTNDPAAAK